MKATVFKDVPVRFWRGTGGTAELDEVTPSYRQLMDRIGQHMADGGTVQFEHRINPEPPGHEVPYELIDCTLYPPEAP